MSFTCSRTSNAARSIFVPQLKSIVTLELSSLEDERIALTLLMVANFFSIGSVTSRSTISGAAPS